MPSDQIIFGYHAVRAILSTQPQNVKQLVISKKRNDARLADIVRLAKNNQVVIEHCGGKEFDQLLVKGETHQGVLVVCHASPTYTEADIELLLADNKTALVLFSGPTLTR